MACVLNGRIVHLLWVIVSLVGFAWCFVSCGNQNSPSNADRAQSGEAGRPASEEDGAKELNIAERIVTAVEHMLDRSNDDAFVIVYGPSDRMFVQFAGSGGESKLLFDFPTMNLTDEERASAERLFAKVPRATVTEFGYAVEFDREATAEASALAVRVFSEVYKLDESTALTIQEH